MTTTPNPVLPTRKTERIAVTLCTVDGCFAAIAVEQTETHAAWHLERATRRQAVER